MLIAPKFLNYEQPEGHQSGGPDVLVRSSVAERFGMPAVNYDSLSMLLEDRLWFEHGHTPVISIYHKHVNYDNPVNQALHQGIDRHSYRFGNTLHINADRRIDRFSPEPDDIDSEQVMRKVILQAAAYSLVKGNHPGEKKVPGKRELILTIGGATVLIAAGIALNSDKLYIGGGFVGAFGSSIVRLGRKTLVKSLSEQAIPKYLPDHKHDIAFPKTERTV